MKYDLKSSSSGDWNLFLVMIEHVDISLTTAVCGLFKITHALFSVGSNCLCSVTYILQSRLLCAVLILQSPIRARNRQQPPCGHTYKARVVACEEKLVLPYVKINIAVG